jgi:recombination protein RecR
VSKTDANPQHAASSPRATPAPARPVAAYPESVERLIREFAALPGIGRRSAERLAFHVLKANAPDALRLARAIEDVKSRTRHCAVCFNLADADASSTSSSTTSTAASRPTRTLCSICAAAGTAPGAAAGRDASLVMVVEQPRDLIALEQTGLYRGVYHVLMGHLSPMDGIGPGDLTIAELLRRVEDRSANCGVADDGSPGRPVREVVLGLNPTLEADGTALYLAAELEKRGVKVTRLARGLPTGSQLEFASKAVLADAIEGRQPV